MRGLGTSTQKRGRPSSARAAPDAGRALGWSFTNTIVARLGTLGIGIVLARLLGPEAFGTYAVAFVALMAILSFNELGVSLAIVRWKGDPAAIAPTVNAISLTMSAALTIGSVLAAPAFARAMGDPSATLHVQLLSLCVLINGLVASPAALLQRAFRQDQRLVADQVNVWVGALVSVGLALAGAGAMSLVIGRLAGAGLSALLFFHFSPLPYRVALDRQFVRPLLSFGVPLAGASCVVFLVGFLDQIVVGSRLGPVQLGYYVLAANLASWPVTVFSQPMRSVAPAMFSRLQHDPGAMRSGLGQVLRLLAAVALPVCAAISVLSDEIVGFVYGADWAPAGTVLKWLAVLAALRILFELSYDFLVVLRRSRAILVIQVVWLLALAPALVLGAEAGGIEGAAVALVVVSGVVSLPMYVLELRRCGIGTRGLATALLTPTVSTVLVSVALLVLTRVVESTLTLFMTSGTVVALTCAALLWRHRSELVVLRLGGQP